MYETNTGRKLSTSSIISLPCRRCSGIEILSYGELLEVGQTSERWQCRVTGKIKSFIDPSGEPKELAEVRCLDCGNRWWSSNKRALQKAGIQVFLPHGSSNINDEVFITSYGECYHRPDCHTLNRSFDKAKTSSLPAHTAIRRGYQPCRYCL